MDICNNFNYILNNYHNLEKVDKNSEIYQYFKDLSDAFKNLIKNRNDIDTEFSIGKGNKALVPWISIYSTNPKIRKNAQEGIGLVYLFRADMSGFYLAISQGITYFKQKYGNNNYAYIAARKVAEYYAEQLDTDTKPIDLKVPKNSIGYGYQEININTKYYEKNKFTYDELKNDLVDMLQQYDDVIESCNEKSWYDVLEKITQYNDNRFLPYTKAVKEIDDTIKSEDQSYDPAVQKELVEITQEAYVEPTKRKIKLPNFKSKKDWIKYQHQCAKNGLIGEKLVLKYEYDKLTKLGSKDLAENIVHVSIEDDSLGYDIKSFEYDKSTNKYEDLYIEVKTTTNSEKYNFFVTKNEIEKSKKYGKKYCIYCLYDIQSEKPKFTKYFGDIETNFNLEPQDYIAKPKTKKD